MIYLHSTLYSSICLHGYGNVPRECPPLNSRHLSIRGTFIPSLQCPPYTGLTVYRNWLMIDTFT